MTDVAITHHWAIAWTNVDSVSHQGISSTSTAQHLNVSLGVSYKYQVQVWRDIAVSQIKFAFHIGEILLSEICGAIICISHWGRVMHIWVGNTGHHMFRWWLVACSAPSHYLNQCWNMVNRTTGNNIQWNSNGNQYIFIQENAFENVVCKMAAISSRPQCNI